MYSVGVRCKSATLLVNYRFGVVAANMIVEKTFGNH